MLQLPFGNLGVMTGHEVCFFEVSRILTCMGADVIALPASFRTPREGELLLASARSKTKYLSSSPIGSMRPHREGAPSFSRTQSVRRGPERARTICFLHLDLAWSRDKQIRPGTDLVRNRRPQFYKPITQTANGQCPDFEARIYGASFRVEA